MSDSEQAGCALIVLLSITFAGGFGCGLWVAHADEQSRAIEAGAARWVIDAKTGERRFEYRKWRE